MAEIDVQEGGGEQTPQLPREDFGAHFGAKCLEIGKACTVGGDSKKKQRELLKD